MNNRTFLRTTLDIFLKSNIVSTIVALVNFCNEMHYNNKRELKFLGKMPIKNIEHSTIENRYLFKVNR